VVKFQLTNRDSKESYDKLPSRNRIAMAITPPGDAEGLRFSPHVYNSPGTSSAPSQPFPRSRAAEA
jgi:hypothetical protein